MSILKGGTGTAEINFSSYVQGQFWRFGSSSEIGTGNFSGHDRTSREPIPNGVNSITLSQEVFAVHFYNLNTNTNLGQYTNQTDFGWGNLRLGPMSTTLSIPNGATHIAMTNENRVGQVNYLSFNDFQNVNVIYGTKPAIQNIYYGTNEVSRVYLGGGLVYGEPVIEYLDATGGAIVTYEDNGKFYKSHTFTSSGNFVVNSLSSDPTFNKLDYLIVAGGGGGGMGRSTTFGTGGGGAGGAGGLIFKENQQVNTGSFPIVIGAGGVGGTIDGSVSAYSGEQGNNTTAFNDIALGGGFGYGANNSTSGGEGENGGSGAGAARRNSSNTIGGDGLQPTSTSGGFGNDGGNRINTAQAGGGGGGAGGVGGNAESFEGGTKGVGLNYSLNNISTTYAEGGRGGGGNTSNAFSASNGGINTGTGGDGGSNGSTSSTNRNSGSGGSGIVIIRYEVGGL